VRERAGRAGGGLVTSLVRAGQSWLGTHAETARGALAEVEAERDDLINYLATLRLVMEILERGRTFEQTCQEIAETLVAEIGAETCVVAIRDAPEAPFRLVGFANQSQRLGEAELRTSITESTWLTAATLMAARGEASTFRPSYRQTPDGALVAAADDGDGDAGLLGLPFEVGGERNGVIILEYVTAPGQQFARRHALALVADTIGGALTICRTQDAMGRMLADLRGEIGATRDELSERDRTLRGRQDTLESMTQALIESNQAKREFLGTVSHELRTPLNAILGYTELLHDKLVGPLTDEQTGMLARVMGSTRHLNQLIDDMLFFVQLEATRTPVRRETFSLGELVREVAGSLPERYHRSKALLLVDVAPGAETLWCDRMLLRRVLFHLLSNGFKFTSAGEVRLIATPWESGDGVKIVVRDTGVGISKERLEEIFHVFRQLDMSNTRQFSGLGLGLALVRRCVRLLDGEIEARSTPGKGSEFTVSLPRTAPERAEMERLPEDTGADAR
jgi:signal transduction histidine kinase